MRLVALLVLFGVAVAIAPAMGLSSDCLPSRFDAVQPVLRVVVSRTSAGFDYRYSLTAQAPAHHILLRLGFGVTYSTEDQKLAWQPRTPPGWQFVAWSQHGPLWDVGGDRRGLSGGSRVEGFGWRAGSRPAIAQALVWVYEPPSAPTLEHCALDVRRSTPAASVTTVAPDGLELISDPVRLADGVVGTITRSRDLRWVDDATASRLQDRARRAADALRSGRRDDWRREADAYLADVAANACRDFTCTRPTSVTSEGYAALYFLMEDLRQR